MKARRLLIAVIAVGALVAAGCGGDRGEDESGGTDTTATDTTETAAGGGGAGDFGDLTGVCGPNEGGGAVTDGPGRDAGHHRRFASPSAPWPTRGSRACPA